MGVGTIVIGLAAVIIGETLLPARSMVITTLACVLGALLYRFFIAMALNTDFMGLQAQDLNLVTAVLVAFALLVPAYKRKLGGRFKAEELMLRAQQLEMTFNPGTPIENRVLRGLSLEIPTGQFVTVIGSNGAGKSTFLNAVSGDLIVDKGSIEIDGNDVTRLNAWAALGMVARVFQDPMAGTCEALTIEENMALAWKRGERRGFGFCAQPQTCASCSARSCAILKLGLENRLADRMGLLSGGAAAGGEPADGLAQALAHPAAGRAHGRAGPEDRRLRAGADRAGSSRAAS